MSKARKRVTPRVRRVLMVHPSAEMYGADRQFVESVRAVMGVAKVHIVLNEGGALSDELDKLGVPVTVVESLVLRRALLVPRELAAAAVQIPKHIWSAFRILLQVRPDLVYVNTVTIPVWLFAAMVARRRRIVHVHETVNESGRLVNLLLSLPLLLSRTVVYNSDAARAAVRESNPLVARLRRETVIRNGIDGNAFCAQDRPDRCRPPSIALVGRLSPRKGTDVAVRAVMILRSRGIDVVLHLYGSTFAGYEWFERDLREIAASDPAAVVFHGFTKKTADAYFDAEIVVVPSRVEPFGNVAVEAMFSARPVVASAVGGLSEIVVDGVTGTLVPPGEPEVLADAIGKLLLDRSLREDLGMRGRSRALSHFGADAYGHRIREEIAAECGTKITLPAELEGDRTCSVVRPRRLQA